MTQPGRLRLGILASGRGSNLAAILEAIDRGHLPAEVVVVASNRPEAWALARARERGIPTVAVPRSAYRDRTAQQAALIEALRSYQVDLVVLAGYDQILIPEFITAFQDRIINIHPSLLPAFAARSTPRLRPWPSG